MASSLKAATLFDRLTADLATLRSEYSNQVLCPLCLRSFGRVALEEKGIDGLSIEHIIPKRLGGLYITLTCRRCNNEHGSSLDAHLVRMIRALNWGLGDGSTLRGTVRIGDIELPMEISWATGNTPRVIRLLGGKESTLEEFNRVARGMKEGDKVNLDFSFDYIQVRARRALIRVAYLALFDRLGYEYVLSEAGTFVRTLIQDDGVDLPSYLTTQLDDVKEERVDRPIILSPIVDGEVIIVYLVILRIETGQKRHHAVLLPASGIPEDAALSVLSEVGKKLHGRRLTISVYE